MYRFDEDDLDILVHSNRKGSHWYKHLFGKWQKQARYANGADDPNAKGSSDSKPKTSGFHAPGTMKPKDAAEYNQNVRAASKAMTTEELKEETARIQAEKNFLKEALVTSVTEDKVKKYVGLATKAAGAAIVANKTQLANWLATKITEKSIENMDELLADPEGIQLVQGFQSQQVAKVLAVISTYEEVSKALKSNNGGNNGGKK